MTRTALTGVLRDLEELEKRIKKLETEYKGFDNYELFMKILRGE